ncbi:hypothetical protein RTBOTA2_000089 [Rhodotorula toruloides]|nr:hypothetical protein RTBOTA2_000089 [Rhodotorula toruloides]
MASDDEMEIDEEAARELDSDDEFATGLDCEVEDDEIWTRFWSEEKQQRRREMQLTGCRRENSRAYSAQGWLML